MFHARACSVRAYTARVATLVLQKTICARAYMRFIENRTHARAHIVFLSHVIEIYDSKRSQITSNNIYSSMAGKQFEPKGVSARAHNIVNKYIFPKHSKYIVLNLIGGSSKIK